MNVIRKAFENGELIKLNVQISQTDVMKKSIVFQVWDNDLGKDDPQGEVPH